MDPFSSTRHRYKSKSFDSPYEPQYKYQKSWLPILRELYADEMDTHTDAKLLFDAIKRGKYRLSKFILDASPSELANSTDIKGKSPLTLCCQIKEQLRRSEMSLLLMEKGADVNLQDDFGRTVMSYACEMKCNDIVNMLIRQNDIDPDLEDLKGNTPLIYSSIVGNDIATEMLTRNFRRLGLEIDHANKNGFTALLTAAKHGNISCARILARQGHASLLIRDKVHGYSVQEWLKLGGYTLEDIVSENKSNKVKSKYVSITRLSIPNNVSDSYQSEDDTSDNDDNFVIHESERHQRDDRQTIHRQSSYREERNNRRDNLDRRGSYWEDRRSNHRDDRRGSPRDDRRGSPRDDRRSSHREDRQGSQREDRRGSPRDDRRGSPRDDRRGSQCEDRRGSLRDERWNSPRQERRNSQRDDRRSSFRDERRESLRRMRKQMSTERERKERLSREIAELIESNEYSGQSTLIIDPNMPVAPNSMLRRKSLKSAIDPTVLKNVIVLPPINKLQVDDSDPSDTDANNTDYEQVDNVKRNNFICAKTNLVPKGADDDDDNNTTKEERVPIF
ncbi:inversin-B-like [Pecten maximus]|uniref:inversin-B-like n=1 Tax=Pecten maximus TaxID=6579 RepID=UPI0014583F7B|nr:inversin-B-like [Pecten maximus]